MLFAGMGSFEVQNGAQVNIAASTTFEVALLISSAFTAANGAMIDCHNSVDIEVFARHCCALCVMCHVGGLQCFSGLCIQASC